MIEIVYGDIFKDEASILVHGCNSRGVFNAGFARQVAEKYPKAKEAYLEAYKNGDVTLGGYIAVKVDNKIIVNAITQENYGNPKNGPYVDYGAFRNVIKAVLTNFPNDVITMPKIGAGLAGGNWKILQQILLEESVGRTIKVYVKNKKELDYV